MSRFVEIGAVLFGLVFAEPRLLAATRLTDGWTIHHGQEKLATQEIEFGYDGMGDSPDTVIEVLYENRFELAEPKPQRIHYLVMPHSWIDYSVRINGALIKDLDDTSFVGQIYSRRILSIPGNTLARENQIQLKARGVRHLGGFRDNEVLITSDSADLPGYGLENLLLNDIHYAMLILILVLVFLCIPLLYISEKMPGAVILLMTALVATIPYCLMATELFTTLRVKAMDVIKLQLAFQSVLFPSFACFFLLYTSNKAEKLWKETSRKQAILAAIYLVPLFIILAQWALPTRVFLQLTSSWFVLSALLAGGALLLMDKKIPLILTYAVSTGMAYATLVSEFLRSNVFLIGYGTMLLTLVGFGLIAAHVYQTHRHQVFLNQFINQFLPNSVNTVVSALVARNESFDQILDSTKGREQLSTVLIDICDWGRLNSYETSNIPPGFVARARACVFSELESIMSSYGLELIKTDGDNMKYCGGLYIDDKNRDALITTRTLEAIREVLTKINEINTHLKQQQLPYVEIKISATYGTCEYGIEKYFRRRQFDTQGHAVNAAYRLETSMDQRFYETYGRNVALISDTIIRECSDVKLLARFPDEHVLQDKHGLAYRCFVGKHAEQVLSLQDFSNAMFNFFKAHPRESARQETAAAGDEVEQPTAPTSLDLIEGAPSRREAMREDLYLGENIKVTLRADKSALCGNVINFSVGGVGIAVPGTEGIDQIESDMPIDLEFVLASQKFDGVGEVVRKESRIMRGEDYTILGVRLLPAERTSSERKHARFKAPRSQRPTLVAESPYSFKKQMDFEVLDLCAHGLGLQFLGEGAGILQGMRLKAALQLPLIGGITCEVEVRNTTIQKNRKIRVGVSAVSNLENFQEMVGKYLLRLGLSNVSLGDLQNEGFEILKVADCMSCRYVRSKKDMEAICDLRLRVWRAMGYFHDLQDATEMRDRFDSNARHVMVLNGARLVASGRVVFNNGKRELVEHPSYGAKLPEWIYHHQFAEISRIVLDPQYRGSDLFMLLCYHLLRIASSEGIERIVLSCHERLFKYYKKLGAEEIGRYQGDDSKEWILAQVNMYAIARDWKPIPLAWALGLDFDALYRDLNESGIIKPTLIGHFNRSIEPFLKPVLKKHLDSCVKRRLASKLRKPAAEQPGQDSALQTATVPLKTS